MMKRKVLLVACALGAFIAQALLIRSARVALSAGLMFLIFFFMQAAKAWPTWWHALAAAAMISLLSVVLTMMLPDDPVILAVSLLLSLSIGAAVHRWRHRKMGHARVWL